MLPYWQDASVKGLLDQHEMIEIARLPGCIIYVYQPHNFMHLGIFVIVES